MPWEKGRVGVGWHHHGPSSPCGALEEKVGRKGFSKGQSCKGFEDPQDTVGVRQCSVQGTGVPRGLCHQLWFSKLTDSSPPPPRSSRLVSPHATVLGWLVSSCLVSLHQVFPIHFCASTQTVLLFNN